MGGACSGWRTLRDGMADLGTLVILPGIKTELLEDTAAFSSMGAEHTSWCGQSFIPSGAQEGAVRSPITCAHLQDHTHLRDLLSGQSSGFPLHMAGEGSW